MTPVPLATVDLGQTHLGQSARLRSEPASARHRLFSVGQLGQNPIAVSAACNHETWAVDPSEFEEPQARSRAVALACGGRGCGPRLTAVSSPSPVPVPLQGLAGTLDLLLDLAGHRAQSNSRAPRPGRLLGPLDQCGLPHSGSTCGLPHSGSTCAPNAVCSSVKLRARAGVDTARRDGKG